MLHSTLCKQLAGGYEVVSSVQPCKQTTDPTGVQRLHAISDVCLLMHRFLHSLSIICLPSGTDLCTRAVELFETLATPGNELTFQVQAQCRPVQIHECCVAAQLFAVVRHSVTE